MSNDVSTIKRVGAYLLDILFIYLLISLIINIKVLNPNYDKLSKAYDSYSEKINKFSNQEITLEEYNESAKEDLYYIFRYGVSTNVVSAVVVFAYFVLFQKFNKGQTIGKKIMKIKVVDNDNKEASIGKYIIREILMYFVLIGNIIALIANSILVLVLKKSTFITINGLLTYASLFLGIVTAIMILMRKDKIGLHDLLSHTKVVNDIKEEKIEA